MQGMSFFEYSSVFITVIEGEDKICSVEDMHIVFCEILKDPDQPVILLYGSDGLPKEYFWNQFILGADMLIGFVTTNNV